MASTKEIRALITLAGKLDPSLQSAMLKATNQQNKFTESSKKSGKSFSLVGQIAKGVFAGNILTRGVSLAINGIKNMASKGTELASSLSEVQNVVDTTFGGNAKQINQWSKTALSAFGLSELQAKQYTGTLGSMLKSSGVASEYALRMSKDLSGLSGDFASFYNLDSETAFEKIRAGISGETEPLKQLGINMSVANLQAFALTKGIKTQYSQMDQASQTMLRYNYLMSVSKDAQGDFAKTLDTSYANQKRLFDTKIQETIAKIASKTMPLLTKGLKFINSLLDKIDIDRIGNGIASAANYASIFIGRAMDVFKFITGNWSAIQPLIWGIVGAMTAWKAITVGMAIYQGVMAGIRAGTVAAALAQWGLNAAVLANPMTWIVVGVAAAIGVLVAGIYLLWKNWDKVTAFIVGAWQNNVIPFFNGVGAWFSGIWTGVVDGFKYAWNGITSWFTNLWDGIVGIFKGYINNYINIFNFIIGALNKIQFDVPDWVPFVGGKHVGINLPLIPAFAKGGFTDQPSIFGEAGPEAAIPLKRTPRSLSLLDKTAELLGVKRQQGNGVSVIFSPTYHGTPTQEIKNEFSRQKEELKELIEEILRDGGRPSFG